jgi:hypothetical protein
MPERNLLSRPRRTLLKATGLLGGLFTLGTARAHHTETHF